jgi:transposase
MLMPEEVKIYLYVDKTDMRKSIDTLSVMVSEVLKMNPTSGNLFLFRNRGGNKLKILYYEPNCFTLWYRRLEKGRFVFPKNAEGHVEISREHFKWLLASDKYSRLDTVQRQAYSYFI